MVGKTTIVHKLQKSTIREEYNNEDTQRQRPLILFFATLGGYRGGNDLTLSLSLMLCTHALYTNFTKVFNNLLYQ